MGIKRIVDTEFWTDSLVLDYFSPEDKYFMLYLLTNPHTKQSGIYKLSKKQVSFETGYTLDTINVLFDRFEKSYQKIIYSQDTQEVAILNYLKHSIIKGGKPVYDCIIKDLEEVKNKELIQKVYSTLTEYFNNTTKESIKQIEVILKDRLPIINDNDNDNDNEESYHDSYHDSSKQRKIKYSDEVSLTQEEYNKLVDNYGEADTKRLIEILDNYKGANGKKYKSDYKAILNWVVDRLKEEKKKEQKPITKFQNFEQDKPDYNDLMRQAREKRIAEYKEAQQ